jgi:hypothetical protein
MTRYMIVSQFSDSNDQETLLTIRFFFFFFARITKNNRMGDSIYFYTISYLSGGIPTAVQISARNIDL